MERCRGSDLLAAVPRSGPSRRELLVLAALGMTGLPGVARAAPQGQVTWGVHVSLAPTWFDPAETSGIITPYMMLYALHDAVVKPMPGQAIAPSLAESFEASKDGLHYDFVLRDGVHFHNGDPVTAEDVKFSFERYRGVANDMFKARVAAVETPDARHVRFTLKNPWPDFLTFYGSATGAGWVVPRKYVEKVGDDGFKKAPVGAGPYKFVSFTPGVEVTMEANEGYWRKPPAVKRLVMRSIPDETTRMSALKGGEVDIIYWVSGELAQELQRTPGTKLDVSHTAAFWLYFPEQFDPKSPWHDVRVRRATSLAIDLPNINKAITLGYSKLTGNAFVPSHFEFYWQPPEPVYDVARAKQLLAEAGHPNGIDGGPYYCDAAFSSVAEAIINSLRDAGIRMNLRPLERAAFYKGYSENQLKGLIQGGSAAFGNAATRLEAFVVKDGVYAYGSYPDIDELFQQQAVEISREKRAALLDRIQLLVHDKVIAAPIWHLAALSGVGPRVGESGIGLIGGDPWSSPYEDIMLKGA
ncbi:MAG: ABC transporter substrate-binding protein [Alphaproteobacteria bacterium]